MKSPWPQFIAIAILFLIAAACDPCGDGGCTAAEERASHNAEVLNGQKN